MHFLQSINSDISVLIVCNKTGGTIKGDIIKKYIVNYKRNRLQPYNGEIGSWVVKVSDYINTFPFMLKIAN